MPLQNRVLSDQGSAALAGGPTLSLCLFRPPSSCPRLIRPARRAATKGRL